MPTEDLIGVEREASFTVDGRKLRFAVEVREGDRVLGVGTHKRRVIPVDGAGES